jgi:adenylylsulfate kinase-like enzyme
MVIWLTGQPGAGKTTLAEWLKAHFYNDGIIIDGDDIRDVYQNKDYSEEGRRKNIERAQGLALFLHHKKMTVIVSLVSPYRDQREKFKEKMGENIKEFYIHTSNIRGRENFHVTNYEPPLNNYFDVDTTDEDQFITFQKIKQNLI